MVIQPYLVNYTGRGDGGAIVFSNMFELHMYSFILNLEFSLKQNIHLTLLSVAWSKDQINYIYVYHTKDYNKILQSSSARQNVDLE